MPGRAFLAFLSTITLCLLAGTAAAQGTTVFNYVGGKRSQLDDFAHEHFGRAYRIVDIEDRERFVFPKGPAVEPPKPVLVRGRCVPGIVTVLFIITASGSVAAPHVAKTENAILSAPALERMKARRFEPAKVDGKPAAMIAVTNIQFACPSESRT